MSTPKYTFFSWNLLDSATPAVTKVRGKKPRQNNVTLNIQIDQSLVASNAAAITAAFLAFKTFSTSETGNTQPYTITASNGKTITLEKSFETLTVTVGGQIINSYEQWLEFITPVTYSTVIAPSQSVEGSFFTVTVSTTGVADGTVIPFVVEGSDAVSTTSGNIVINGGTGVATIATIPDADITADTATLILLGAANGKPGSTATFTITEPAAATFATVVTPAINVEGSFFSVTVTTSNVPDGTVIPFVVTGSDAVVTTTGNIIISGNAGVATIQTTADADIVDDSATVSLQGIALGKPGSTATFTITEPAPAPDSVLTTAQDLVTATSAAVFTIYGNEATLGQNDQLNGAAAGAAVLNIGTDGNFAIANFTSTDVDTFEFRPADDLGAFGYIDMQSAFDVTDIVVDQSSLAEFYFDDIQSVDSLSASLTDSFSDFTFNFDASALLGASNAMLVSFAEAPIDATTGEALGIRITEGPFDAQADLEILSLESTGAITNILDRLAVGEGLETLNMFGGANLEILPDIGFLGEGNSRISLIDASGLNADLNNGPSDAFFTYTSALSGAGAGFEVSVFGATGVNRLALGTAPLDQPATDFRVITQDSADQIFTVGGNDSILSAGGNDTVNAGDGNNVVRSGLGSDSVVTLSGNDTVEAGEGNNTVDAGDGINSVTALAGNDSIRTGAGNDAINAGDGINTVSAGGGNDSVITGIGTDLVYADDAFGINDGNDTIRTGAGADTVYAGSGSNIVDAGTESDFVALGSYAFGLGAYGLKLGDDTFANTVGLGDGDDILAIDTDSLTIADSINGGAGLDTIRLYNGGVLSQSETLRVSRIETLELVGAGDYDITLSDELVRTSDQIGSRVFNVAATNFAGNVTLDLSFLTPVDAVGELLSIRFTGQGDTDTETVIIRDGLISDQTVLAFGEAPADADETFADIMQILDSVDITKDDLDNVSGLEVIELASSVNGPQTFTLDWRNMTESEFNTLVGDSTDVLIIRATPLLGNSSASTLNLDLTGATFNTSRIIIEESAFLNVNVVGGSPVIETALFFTPNADRIPSGAVIPGVAPFIPDGATVIAYALSDLQDADFVNANEVGDNETIEFRFAPSSSVDSLFDQLNFIDVFGIDIFRFIPAAVNQAVSFDSISNADPGAFEGLDSVITSGGNDYLVNIERSLYVETRGGNDTVTFDLFAGPATVVSGDGNDSVLTTDLSDLVNLGFGNNTASTFAGNDFISALDGNDLIFAGEDNDTVLAGDGNNFIDGFDGNDSLFAGIGNDTIVGGFGNDSIGAGDGNNSVEAGFGFDSVTAGIGNDWIRTSVDSEVEDDTVRSGAGLDTVLVGLGNDLVDAGLDNDLIVLGSSFTIDIDDVQDPVLANEVGGYTFGDFINGGAGIDTVSLAIDANTTLVGNIVNVENINVSVRADNLTLTIGPSLIPIGDTLTFTISDSDIGDRTGFVFDATALVQDQSLIVNDADLGSATYLLGASDDVYNGDTTDETQLVTVAGNGGSDTINLGNGTSTVRYNTGNDGGTGGTGTGGDFITGFTQGSDQIQILDGLLTDLGGLIDANTKVSDAQLVLGGLTTNGVPVNLSGDNILSLTGPSRSLLDTELTNAARVASNINGVGVVGNGLALNEAFGTGIVNRVTNQALIVQQGQTQTALYLYTESSFNFDVAQAYSVEAGELRQLGIFDNALLTGSSII